MIGGVDGEVKGVKSISKEVRVWGLDILQVDRTNGQALLLHDNGVSGFIHCCIVIQYGLLFFTTVICKCGHVNGDYPFNSLQDFALNSFFPEQSKNRTKR